MHFTSLRSVARLVTPLGSRALARINVSGGNDMNDGGNDDVGMIGTKKPLA